MKDPFDNQALLKELGTLREKVEKYESILANIEDGYFECDLNGDITFFNPAIENFFGYSNGKLQGVNYKQIIGEENADKVYEQFNRVYTTSKASRFDFQIKRKNGSKSQIEAAVSLIRDREGKKIGFRAIARDITRQKEAQESLKESEVRWRTVLEAVQEGITFSTRKGYFEVYNSAMERLTGYSLEEANACADFTKLLYPDPKDRERALEGISELLVKETHRESEAAILTKSGEQKQVLISSSLVSYKGQEMFLSTYRDITEANKKEEELCQSFVKLRQAMGGTIQALAGMVESRDPYTAGHQLKVARLGRAIAQEMGLSEEEVEGIRMAGAIHDLGKISVPAEILSKPGKLEEMELTLIKIHPQVGYNILKDVEFPWPLAKIILQHHERINGTGYPQGLKGEEILLEARILAVADVVEAIASHRPYRPARGIEVALEEVSINKGILYDPDAVEICLRLFNEKGFRWE